MKSTLTFTQQIFVVLFCFLLFSCSTLRTELFREETHHRYKQACTLYQQGDYDSAREEFETVLDFDPDYGPAHAALGNLAMIKEAYTEAAEHYGRAIEVDPELEAELAAMRTVAAAHTRREPLRRAEVSLGQVYPLVMEDKQAELEAVLEKEIPLDLLAGDTMSITPGKMREMQAKIAETVRLEKGSVRYRLFAGYLLFYGKTNDAIAAKVILETAPAAETTEQQKAFVMLGHLCERLGKKNDAVNAYLAAVHAGLPLADVAHHLARVYGVDIATILPERQEPSTVQAASEPMAIEIRGSLPAQPHPDRDTISRTSVNDEGTAKRQPSPYHF
jgi:tetratricopeptide (TPR) repeat protein